MKLLNIVIVNYNNWKYLASCIASIFKSSLPKDGYEIIVVDNASTDLSLTLLDYLVKQKEPIKVIKNSQNENYTKGNNIGLKAVDSEYILFLNDDTELDKDCLKEMLEIFKLEPKVGMVGAIQLSPYGGLVNPPKGKFNRDPKDWSSMGFEPCTFEELPKPYIEVDTTNIACAMIPRKVFDEIGYLDERFWPCMYEQEDYIVRIKLAGYKILVCTTAKLIHYVARTTNATSESARYYTNVVLPKNRKVFIEKWKDYFEKGLI